ncbi:MAG: diaminopimelate epimerase [Verrucomicrobiales bacterium]|jgi:diaminopimelate epimerase|nr:diaminopimelate epimerase [Verrucomicrobiales bacterium]
MKLNFWKMNGAGNDFVCLDNRDRQLRLSRRQIARLCCRQFGVGADGVLALEPARTADCDFRMRYYNADGGEAAMCGNGARCFARFAQQVTGSAARQLRFDTGAGPVGAEFFGRQVRVELTAPRDLRLDEKIQTPAGALTVSSLNTGVPHAVVIVSDTEKIDVPQTGAVLRWHRRFQPQGVNVNFAQVLAPGQIQVRTYERGVEAETLACGTGVTATALVAAAKFGWRSPVTVSVRSGAKLRVLFTVSGSGVGAAFTRVKLHGPAEFTFKGELYV